MENINDFIINDEEYDLICKYIKIRYKSKLSQRDLAKRIGLQDLLILQVEEYVRI